MAHFAQLDDNNVVTNVIVIADSDTPDENGNEVESIGAAFCQNLLGGRWVQTSYKARLESDTLLLAALMIQRWTHSSTRSSIHRGY